jgi:hypothetical protein
MNGNQSAHLRRHQNMRLRAATPNVWNNQGDLCRADIIDHELRRFNPNLVSLQEVIDAPVQNRFETLFGGLDLHNTPSWRLNAEANRERRAFYLGDLDSRHRFSFPTIIAGDFNASPETSCIRYISGLQSIDGRSVKYHLRLLDGDESHD